LANAQVIRSSGRFGRRVVSAVASFRPSRRFGRRVVSAVRSFGRPVVDGLGLAGVDHREAQLRYPLIFRR
jgi:hypothetical protein